MSIEQSDGSIMPSHIYVSSAQANDRNDPFFRIGKVVAIYYPTNTGNYSKKFIEYDVLCDHIDTYGMHTKVLYPRCKVLSLFGGAADFTDWTYRQSTLVGSNQSGSTNGPSKSVDNGSTVALVCVNGDVRQGVIIGGLKHANLSNNANFTPTFDAGTHLNFEFNGVVIQINDSGEFSLTFNGKTNADNTLDSSADASNSGSNINFTKDGSIILQTPSNDQSVTLDNTSKEMTLDADKAFNVNANGNAVIKTAGILNGAATDAFVLGTTYRQAQSTMDNQLTAELTTAGSVITAAAAQLTAAGAVLTVPIIGNLIAGPMIAAAAAQLVSAGAALTSAATAITTFEALTLDFLSTKNFTD